MAIAREKTAPASAAGVSPDAVLPWAAKERTAESYTVSDLSVLGFDRLPDLYRTERHLIYNSPATLAFNSPGAEGFGVKRAGLAIPGSVMLIVSPGCCGRNTSEIAAIKGCEDRFFYLEISETDLVTARHLRKIPEAVSEIVSFCEKKPSLVMVCITCVDALLGTDMERVCRAAEEAAGLPVRPCYMYALTREGRRPPMVQVRESLYSLLPAQKKRGTSVNLLGYFAPVDPDSELFSLLRAIGVKHIREISTCPDIEEFYRMGEANFNLVLNPEARAAADDLSARLSIPYIELTRFYGPNRIEHQYEALAGALGVAWDSSKGREEAESALSALKEDFPGLSFSIGETLNANPFELALTLCEAGFSVREIFRNPAREDYYYLDRLSALSPETSVCSNMEPTMIYYDGGTDENNTIFPETDLLSKGAGKSTGPERKSASELLVTLGKDSAWYHPDAIHILWNSDEQPFGYAGLRKLTEAVRTEVERFFCPGDRRTGDPAAGQKLTFSAETGGEGTR